jgi:hypothetical protein
MSVEYSVHLYDYLDDKNYCGILFLFVVISEYLWFSSDIFRKIAIKGCEKK